MIPPEEGWQGGWSCQELLLEGGSERSGVQGVSGENWWVVSDGQ